MSTASESGWIVLKAAYHATVVELAAQLSWYAAFDEPFANKYEGGWAIRGTVRQPADGMPEVAALQLQLVALATRVGQLESERDEARRQQHWAEQRTQGLQQVFDELTPAEHMRLLDRRLAKLDVEVVAADDPEVDQATQAIVAAMLERAARRIQQDAPDLPFVDLRQADACAAIVRGVATEAPRDWKLPEGFTTTRRRRRP